MAHMYMRERVVQCITKSPSERTDEEINSIIAWFSKMSKILQNLNQGTQNFY